MQELHQKTDWAKESGVNERQKDSFRRKTEKEVRAITQAKHESKA